MVDRRWVEEVVLHCADTGREGGVLGQMLGCFLEHGRGDVLDGDLKHRDGLLRYS